MAIVDEGILAEGAEGRSRRPFALAAAGPAARVEPREIDVDIVIDNFNYARFLPRAIESALAQTHPCVRVIVVDDGSTDESREILASYADRVELVFKENGGQASALNAGLERCTGDVAIFLDADDELDHQIAARVCAVFAHDPKTVHVPYRLAVVDGHGRRNGLLKPPRDMDLPSGEIADAKLTFPFDVVSVGTSGNAFSVAALRQVMPMPEVEFASCADWYLVHVLPLVGRVTALDQIGGHYRVHGDNAYELTDVRVDLDHIRDSVRYADVTKTALTDVSGRLGMPLPFTAILSVSDLANRLISLRLDPDRHPVRDDTVLRVVRDGTRAAFRRWDSPPVMKAIFVAWFLLAGAAPRPLLNRLALVFLFRERRTGLNKVLYALPRSRRPLEVRHNPEA
jgi:hypothetical protein